MAINIIVEDGSNIANANAYISIADMRTFATNRGITLPAEDDVIAVMIIKASDYLESLACEYMGQKTNDDQSLEWPRACVFFTCDEYPDNQIPKALIKAQAQLVLAVNDGFDLQPNVVFTDYVTEETVGPITTKYSDPAKLQVVPTLTAASKLLEQLTGTGCGPCGGGAFAVRRV